MSHFLEATDTGSWAHLFWSLACAHSAYAPPVTNAPADANFAPAVGRGTAWARLTRAVSRRRHSRAAARADSHHPPQPAQSDALTEADALLATAHDDLVAVVYAQHPAIADADLSLREKLASLPDGAGIAADAAALRSCLRSTPDGERMTLDPCMQALCARIAAAVPRVPELCALALRLVGSVDGSIEPALRAATQLLATERALPRVTDVEVHSVLWPAQHRPSELEQSSQMLTRLPSVTRLRLPQIGVNQGHKAFLAASLPSLPALRRLCIGSECDCTRQVERMWPNASVNLSGLQLTALRSLDVSGNRHRLAPRWLADAVRTLPRLRRLRVSCAGLDDAALVAVLQALRGTLRHLDVSLNRLRCRTGCARAICSALSLQRLDLGGNNIEAAAAVALVRRLPALTALQHLDLGAYSAKDGDVFARAAVSLASLTKLSFVSVEGMKTRSAAAAALASALAALPRLRDLRLTGSYAGIVAGGTTALRRLRVSGMERAGAQRLALALPALTRLLHFEVAESSESWFRVLDERCAVLLRGLAAAPQLQSFQLTGWEVRGEAGEQALMAVLPCLTCLAQLQLQIDPTLSTAWCQLLPVSITHMALNVRKPTTCCQNGDHLPDAIARVTHLRSLQIFGLNIQDQGNRQGKLQVAQRWGKALAQLPRLHSCELHDLNMEPAWLQQLAPHLSRCRVMTRLCLHGRAHFRPEVKLHHSQMVDAVALGEHLRALPRLQFLRLQGLLDNSNRSQYASALEAAMADMPGLELQVL